MSVYLSVAPPDGFTNWGEPEWDRWLREHPWESAERICSRGDWAIFLFQLRAHADNGKKLIEPALEALLNERPLLSQGADDLQLGLSTARQELSQKSAALLKLQPNNFVGADDLEQMITSARRRLGREPTMADVWAEVFEAVDKVLKSAVEQKRGVYFGNV